jgi:hypothetical protein
MIKWLSIFGAVPKWLREQSAKLRFVGSIPTRTSTLSPGGEMADAYA